MQCSVINSMTSYLLHNVHGHPLIGTKQAAIERWHKINIGGHMYAALYPLAGSYTNSRLIVYLC